MSRLRLVLVLAVGGTVLVAGAASASLRERCYEDAPFRLLPFCRYVPDVP